MARRPKTDNGHSAAEKTTKKTLKQPVEKNSEQAVESRTEQAIEEIAERITERAVGKVLDETANKFADEFLEKIASKVVQDVAAQFTDKIVAGIVEKLAGNTDESTTDNTSEAANKSSDETVKKAKVKNRAKTEDSAAEGRPLRRSARQATASAAGSKRQSPEVEDLPPPKRARTMREPEQRRNPKRKVSEEVNSQARETADLSENLLEETLKPLSAADIQEWDGWAEVESEPAFFNIILQRLEVPGIKATELLAAEQWALDYLQKPVFGLIFLFQYAPHLEDEDEDGEEEAPIWFANQTTNNSCASVAILNIVMNADEAELGDQLRAFKESTRDLSTPLRGHRIGSDDFIRAAHNSFVRRVDQLNADLCLANEADAASLKPARKRAVPKKEKRQQQPAASKKQKANVDYGFHFIAYVPAGGHVWELDGMRTKPHKIGTPLPNEDWTGIARPRIQARMQQYQENENGFSLLALCRSPLVAHRNAIASAVAEMLHLRSEKQHDAQFVDIVSADEAVIDIESPAELREFGLEKSDIINAHVPQSHKARISEPNFDADKAYSRYQELVIEARSAMGTYRQAIIDVADEEKRVKAREKDYTPALHCWMKQLAEKGVLEDVIKTSR